MNTRPVGQRGEDRAVDYLRAKGYKIIQRNFSTRFGEIDIIAMDKDVWVFVEVKTKSTLDFGRPEEMVNRSKLERIKRMATLYLNGREEKCRIDVVGVVGSEVKHWENAS